MYSARGVACATAKDPVQVGLIGYVFTEILNFSNAANDNFAFKKNSFVLAN